MERGCSLLWVFYTVYVQSFVERRVLLWKVARAADPTNFMSENTGLQVGWHIFATRIHACAEFSIQNPHKYVHA